MFHAKKKTMRERDTTYDNIPGGVMTVLVTDTNFYIMEANHQYFTMVGTTREQYLGSSGIYTYPQDLPGLRSHIIEQARKQEPLDYDFSYQASSLSGYKMVPDGRQILSGKRRGMRVFMYAFGCHGTETYDVPLRAGKKSVI